MNNTPTEPLDTAPDDATTDLETARVDDTPTTALSDAKDGDVVASAAVPARRRAVWVSVLAVAVLVAVAAGGYYLIQTIQYGQAHSAFTTAAADRADAYAAQEDAISALRDAETQALVDYPQLLAIGNTLTDTTVADPAARAKVLTAAAELAQAAWITLDAKNLPTAEQTPILAPLIPNIPLQGPTAAADIEELDNQTTALTADASAVESYTELVDWTTANITSHTQAGIAVADEALTSAATQGQKLSYDRAPAETKAMVAAAKALTTDDALNAPLEDKAALVTTYLTAVRAASAKQKAVIATEKAEADRIAAEQHRQNQNSSRNGGTNGSWNGGSKPGSSHGGTNPGNGGTNPGNGGTTPNPGGGGGSNWQPIKVQYAGACDGVGGVQEVSYGSWLTIPASGVGSSSTYEIPGVGWGVTWKCKHW